MTRTNTQAKPRSQFVWENLQLLVLGLTIAGQVVVGPAYLIGQTVWAVANTLALTRDFMLHRPAADKIKNSTMLALTLGLIIAKLLGAF